MLEGGKAELLFTGPYDPSRLDRLRIFGISVTDHRGGLKLKLRGGLMDK